MVPKEGAGSYHLGSSKPLEDTAVDCRCAPYVVERANGNPPYVVGGYVYGVEVRPGPTWESLEGITGNTWAYTAWDTEISTLAVDPSPTGMAGHCRYCSDDWEIAQEGL